MKVLLQIERLKTLSDSVLLVGIALLVYNLASLAATKLYNFDSETFLNTLDQRHFILYLLFLLLLAYC